ncbi:MAG: 2-oxoglutarate dehydrogenase E1 component, partial [Bacteroidetes bacterium]|nr:2-oxoglutarate dehydrogenase E1 component [Bacteroidota bacterium]
MDSFSYLNTIDPEMVEDLYQKFLKDPDSVDQSWKLFFDGYEFSRTNYSQSDSDVRVYPDEFKVINLINDYRQRGHLFTETNPVRKRRSYAPTLDIENYGLTAADQDKLFQAGTELGIGRSSLKDIVSHLKETYCRSVGSEYEYIRNTEIVKWIQNKIESSKNTYPFTLEDKHYILRKLGRAVFFEKFVHKRFPGQKRFSLEGAESLIPALDAIMELG